MEYLIETYAAVPDVDAMTDFSVFTPLIEHINDPARIMTELNGNVELLKLLLERGVDPSANDNNAILNASKNGHLAVVERLLMDPRVNPSADDNYAIRCASYNGHIAVVERLLQEPEGRGVDPSADNNYAILWASINGHTAVVVRLFQDSRVMTVMDRVFFLNR